MANRASAIDLIRAERGRQISKGWTADHDDTHVHGEISVAAADLLLHSTDERRTHNYHETDAWGLAERHCKDDVKSLVIAGALVVAELERVLRKSGGNGARARENLSAMHRRAQEAEGERDKYRDTLSRPTVLDAIRERDEYIKQRDHAKLLHKADKLLLALALARVDELEGS